MSQNDPEKLIHAFISSRVDFPYSLLTGVNKTIKQLQLVQNGAAKVLTGTARTEHMTPELYSWLQNRFERVASSL